MRSTTLVRVLSLSIVLAYAILTSVSFLTAHERELINHFEDDSFYYFKIASNIVDRGQITFDGHTITNGFHPLWMVVILPFFFALRDPIAVLRAVGVFSAGLGLLTAYAGLQYLKRFSTLPYLLGAALLLICIVLFGSVGLEVTLLSPLIVIALGWLATQALWSPAAAPRKPAALLRLGLVLSAIQLCRLDAVFLNAAILAFCGLKNRGREKWRELLIVAAPIIATGSAYLAVNYAAFKHLTPVSGAVKMMSNGGINDRFLGQLFKIMNPDGTHWTLFLIMLALALGLVGFFVVRRLRDPDGDLPDEFCIPIIASCFLIAFTAYYLFWGSWQLWLWYLYPLLPMSVFVVPIVIEHLFQHLKQFDKMRGTLRSIGGILAVVLIGVMAGLGLRWGNWRDPLLTTFGYENYRVAREMNARFQSPVIIAAGDRAGSFAYFFEGDVLQLEGLVGSFEVVEAIENNQLMDYMSTFGVQYLLSHHHPPEDYSEWNLLVPDPGQSSGPRAEIRLCRQTEFLRHIAHETTIYIWRWPSCGTIASE